MAYLLLPGGHGHVRRRNSLRPVLITTCFAAGALAGAFVAWQLVPREWTLPFWRTWKAAVDAETYGHPVEHYAQGVVLMLTSAAVLVGAAACGVAALLTRTRAAARDTLGG